MLNQTKYQSRRTQHSDGCTDDLYRFTN